MALPLGESSRCVHITVDLYNREKIDGTWDIRLPKRPVQCCSDVYRFCAINNSTLEVHLGSVFIPLRLALDPTTGMRGDLSELFSGAVNQDRRGGTGVYRGSWRLSGRHKRHAGPRHLLDLLGYRPAVYKRL